MSKSLIQAYATQACMSPEELLSKARAHMHEMNRKARRYGLGDCYSMEDAIQSVASQK